MISSGSLTAAPMKIEVLRAWPRRYERIELDLPQGARVIDALGAAGVDLELQAGACAVFGVAAGPDTELVEGDRIELLGPLQADPKEARRRRAGTQRRDR
jgi:uncharacterized protein